MRSQRERKTRVRARRHELSLNIDWPGRPDGVDTLSSSKALVSMLALVFPLFPLAVLNSVPPGH